MGRHDWYRRTTWSADHRSDFFARLKRCRPSDSAAQYLRIQASHLADAGYHPDALQLLDQLIREHAVEPELAQAHLQRAQSLVALGRDDDAVEAFRASLNMERRLRNFGTVGWLEFAWFIACREKRQLFDEALAVLDEFEATSNAVGLMFPGGRFKYAGALALMAAACGDAERAHEFARDALENAAATDSGLRHHSNFGVVGAVEPAVRARLEAIAGGFGELSG